MRLPALLALLALATGSSAGASGLRAQDQTKPVFRAGVNLVMVTVVVQNKDGRPVTGLTRGDFQVFDDGRPQAITDFRADASPVRVALLFDLSGSMEVSTKMADGRGAARQLLSWLDPKHDQAALYGFETGLTEIVPFTAPIGDVDRALDALKPFGATSLYDAIAETGRRVASQGGSRRAVVVISDGADNSSQMRPADVANLASGIDVPVYVMAVSLPIDHPGGSASVVDAGSTSVLTGPLAALAPATGGQLFVVSTPAHWSLAARQIVADLRSEYVLTFEPGASGGTGLHPLSVVTRDKHLIVRTRSGYTAGTATRQHD